MNIYDWRRLDDIGIDDNDKPVIVGSNGVPITIDTTIPKTETGPVDGDMDEFSNKYNEGIWRDAEGNEIDPTTVGTIVSNNGVLYNVEEPFDEESGLAGFTGEEVDDSPVVGYDDYDAASIDVAGAIGDLYAGEEPVVAPVIPEETGEGVNVGETVVELYNDDKGKIIDNLGTEYGFESAAGEIVGGVDKTIDDTIGGETGDPYVEGEDIIVDDEGEGEDEFVDFETETGGGETGTGDAVDVEVEPETVIEEGPNVVDTDVNLYQAQADQRISDIYDPLIEGQEQAKEALDFQAELKIEGINKSIPYITRQFESYQAKSGISSGTQARQQNELVMDIANSIGNVFDEVTMGKYAIDSKISEYQSAMAAGKQALATDLYNQALSQAQFNADYLGMDFVQPEIQFIYDQMTASKAVLNDTSASDEDRATAQANYEGYVAHLQGIGYSGDIGEGLQTYQQQQDAIQQAYMEMEQFISSELYDVEMSSLMATSQAIIALTSINPATGQQWTYNEILSAYPLADPNELFDWIQKQESGGFSLDDIG